MKKNMLVIIVAILATLMCVEASAQRARTVTSFTGRHTFLMSVEANAMADTDPIDGSFKADLGGLAKITYFKNGNHFSAKLGYRRESFQAALAYARNLTTKPSAKFRPNIEVEAGLMNQTRSLYYEADETTTEGKPLASHEYWNYKLRPYVGLNINFEVGLGSSAIEVGAFGYYLPYEGKAAPGNIKTTVGGSDVTGQQVKMDLDTSKFKFGVKVTYKFDICKIFK